MIRLIFLLALMFYAIQFFSPSDPVPPQMNGDLLEEVLADQKDAGFIMDYDGLVKIAPDPNRNSAVQIGDKRYRVYKSFNNHNTLMYFYFGGNYLRETSNWRFR